ncbi:Membrane alanine aminopeptidase [Globisporangium polare]
MSMATQTPRAAKKYCFVRADFQALETKPPLHFDVVFDITETKNTDADTRVTATMSAFVGSQSWSLPRASSTNFLQLPRLAAHVLSTGVAPHSWRV